MDRNRGQRGEAPASDINLYTELDAKLRHLDIYAFGRGEPTDYSFLIDAAERGDWRAAQKRCRQPPSRRRPSRADYEDHSELP